MASAIVEKLKLQKYNNVALLNVPTNSNYFSELKDYETELGTNTFDLIFAFVLDMDSLKK